MRSAGARTTAPLGRTAAEALSDKDFDVLRTLIKKLTGINLAETKRDLVYRRLAGRLRTLQIPSFADYIEFLKSGDDVELEAFMNAVTTNLTSFFRESHHFDYLTETILPEIVAKKGAGPRRLRIWSAGCSTGEEPYSIAITLREQMANIGQWDAKILATDLDSDVIATCRRGQYGFQRVEQIPVNTRSRWFQANEATETVEVKQPLRDLITFKRLNLMGDWPMKGPFDVIFCRNVIIYFDKPTQKTLIDRYADILSDDGYLVLGHSESLHNASDRFSLIGKTIYRKVPR